VDFALTLPGVDPGMIALMGISMGGNLHQERPHLRNASPLIANDCVYDYGAANFARSCQVARCVPAE
jgi:hypothetical protein